MVKKNYSKPDILFEDFSLSTNIAAGCEVKTNTSGMDECGVKYGPTTVFVSGVDECEKNTVITDGSQDSDSICYHTFADTNNVFNS